MIQNSTSFLSKRFSHDTQENNSLNFDYSFENGQSLNAFSDNGFVVNENKRKSLENPEEGDSY